MQVLLCDGLWSFDNGAFACSGVVTAADYASQAFELVPADLATALGAGFISMLPVLLAIKGGRFVLSMIR